MLILTRKKGRSFFINDDIKVTVHDISRDSVRIAIDAPRDVRILREELLEETREANEQAAGQENVKLSSIENLRRALHDVEKQ